MADSSEGGTGKPSPAAHNTPGGAKPKGRRVQGGRVVESRYLQYEKKTKKAPAADAFRPGGKVAEGGRKASLLQKSRADGSGIGKEPLQSTLLEGHSMAPLDLDLSVIKDGERPGSAGRRGREEPGNGGQRAGEAARAGTGEEAQAAAAAGEAGAGRRPRCPDKSMLRKTSLLDKTMSKKPKSAPCAAQQQKKAELEMMEMMESQTLLLSLLSVKMENGLAQLEEKAERSLALAGRERERLVEQAHGMQRRLLLRQKTQELGAVLDAQIELLSPLEAVAGRFQEQYRTLATALDTTRHELPMNAIHLEGDGQQLLDALQRELRTTQQLLAELGCGDSQVGARALDLLGELKDVTEKKDLELRRSFAEVLQLSAEATKEAALESQEVWEEAQGLPTVSNWYFHPDAGFGGPQGEPRSTGTSGGLEV